MSTTEFCTQIELPYGEDPNAFHLNLPPGQEANILTAMPLPGLADLPGAVLEALDSPLDTPPLRDIVKPGHPVSIVINDATRMVKSEIFLPLLVNYLNRAGIPDKSITLLVAVGTHRPATSDEFRQLAGEELLGRVRVKNHQANDPAELVELGRTSRGTPVVMNRLAVEAGTLILTGGIGFHYMAGFSGGRKSLVPGVAALNTIRTNHRLVLDAGDLAAAGKIEGNPLAEDMEEAARFRQPEFILNVVLNDAGQAAGVFAGHWQTAHRAGCDLVARYFGVGITGRKPLVVASAGGFPKDINLYQAFKGLFTAMDGVQRGGEVVFVAECREGIGNDEFFRFASRTMPDHEKVAMMREEFTIARYVGYLTATWTKRANIRLISSLPNEQVREMGMIPCRSLADALADCGGTDLAGRIGSRSFWLMPHAATMAILP